MKTYTFFVAPECWDEDPSSIMTMHGIGEDATSAYMQSVNERLRISGRQRCSTYEHWVLSHALLVVVEGRYTNLQSEING